MALDRIDAVNVALAARGPHPTYLEVGVWEGDAFGSVSAARKFGVDIAFHHPGLARRARVGPARAALRLTRGELLFQMPSDRFFAAHRRLLTRHPPDVALVDGLHTAEQAYRDVTNTVDRLAPGGLVIMHDCSPATEVAAWPDHAEAARQPEFNGAWNGDVWKAVLRLRASRRDLRVVVLDADHGLGLVSRGEPGRPAAVAEAEIDALTWADLDANRSDLLDLRPPDDAPELLGVAPAS